MLGGGWPSSALISSPATGTHLIGHRCYNNSSIPLFIRGPPQFICFSGLVLLGLSTPNPYPVSFSVHWPLIRLFLLPASFCAKQIIDFPRPFPNILHTSAMPRNKMTPLATQTSFMQVNRRHSSFTLARPPSHHPVSNPTSLTLPEPRRHLVLHTAAPCTLRQHRCAAVQSECMQSPRCGGSTSFPSWPATAHLPFLQFKTDGERVYNSTSQSSSFPQPLYQVTFQFIPALASRLLCCCRLACPCTISHVTRDLFPSTGNVPLFCCPGSAY